MRVARVPGSQRAMTGTLLGHYRILAKLGEGGPPSLAPAWGPLLGELRRGLAEAERGRTR